MGHQPHRLHHTIAQAWHSPFAWPPVSQDDANLAGVGGTVPSVATNITMVALFLLWPPTSQEDASNAGVGGTVPSMATSITRQREQSLSVCLSPSFCATRRRKPTLALVALFLLWPPTSQWSHCSSCGHQHHKTTQAAGPPTSQWWHCSSCGHQHHNGGTVPPVATNITRRRKLLGHQPHQLHTIAQARHGPVAWPAASQDGAGGAGIGGAVDGGVGHGHGLRTAVVLPPQRLLAGDRRRDVRMVRRHPSTGARGGHRPAVPAGTSLRRHASLPRQSVEGCGAGLAFLPLQSVEGCGAGLAFLPLQSVEGGGGGGRLTVLALQ